MDDLIKRSDAIRLAEQGQIQGFPWQFEQLVKLPSVPLERKKGKWIEKEKGIHVTSYRCSECGRTVMDDTGYDVSADYPFCNCGADMRGE